MSGLTLDTGALIALERRDARAMRLVGSARREREVVVPAAVLVEWWRGPGHAAERILESMRLEPLVPRLARTAGEALARIGRGPSAIDAIVMASAASRGDTVLTSDVDDLERLRAFFPTVRVLRV